MFSFSKNSILNLRILLGMMLSLGSSSFSPLYAEDAPSCFNLFTTKENSFSDLKDRFSEELRFKPDASFDFDRPLSSIEKLALLEALRDLSPGTDEARPQITETDAIQFAKSLKAGKFTTLEVTRLMTKLYTSRLESNPQSKGLLKRWGLSHEGLLRKRVEAEFLSLRGVPDLLAALKKHQVLSDPTRVQDLKSYLDAHPWISKTAYFAFLNTVLFMGYHHAEATLGIAVPNIPIFPLDIPLTQLRRASEKVRALVKKGNIQGAIDQFRADSKIFHISPTAVEVTIRAALRALSTVLLGAMLYVSVKFLPAVVDFIDFNYFTSREAKAQIESKSYDSEKIVRDVFESWLSAFDTPPSALEQQIRLNEIRTNEASGTYRVYQ